MRVRVMFIGGRLHRQFLQLPGDGFGYPALAIYRNTIPRKQSTLPLPGNWRMEATQSERYHKRILIVDRDLRTQAFVYVLEGIEEYYLNQAYLEEPGIMDQLQEIAK